jgi:hypothetical protein
MSLLLAILAAGATWAVAALFAIDGLSAMNNPYAVMFLLFYIPLFCVPLLLLFTIAAAAARALAAKPLRQVLLFYAFTVLLSLGALGAFYMAAPNPGNRDAALRSMFELMLIPSLLSSAVFALFVPTGPAPEGPAQADTRKP